MYQRLASQSQGWRGRPTVSGDADPPLQQIVLGASLSNIVIVVGTWWADESGGVPGTALLRDVKPALSSNGHDSKGTPTSSTAICRTGARPSPLWFRRLRPKERIPPPRSDHTLGSRGRSVRQDPSTPRGLPLGRETR